MKKLALKFSYGSETSYLFFKCFWTLFQYFLRSSSTTVISATNQNEMAQVWHLRRLKVKKVKEELSRKNKKRRLLTKNEKETCNPKNWRLTLRMNNLKKCRLLLDLSTLSRKETFLKTSSKRKIRRRCIIT